MVALEAGWVNSPSLHLAKGFVAAMRSSTFAPESPVLASLQVQASMVRPSPQHTVPLCCLEGQRLAASQALFPG